MKKILFFLSVLFISIAVFSPSSFASLQWQLGQVDTHHEFKVRFSSPVDEATFDAITVLNARGEQVAANISLSANDSNVVLIEAPENGYIAGQSYSIEFKDQVKSVKGKSLKERVVAPFSIKLANVEGEFVSFVESEHSITVKAQDGTLQNVALLEDGLYYYDLIEGREEAVTQEFFIDLLTFFETVQVSVEEQNGQVVYKVKPTKFTGNMAGFDGAVHDEMVVTELHSINGAELYMPEDGQYAISYDGVHATQLTKDEFVEYFISTEAEAIVAYELFDGVAYYDVTITSVKGELDSFFLEDSVNITHATITVNAPNYYVDLPMIEDGFYTVKGIGLENAPFHLGKEGFQQLLDQVIDKTVQIEFALTDGTPELIAHVNSFKAKYDAFSQMPSGILSIALTAGQTNEGFDLPLLDTAAYEFKVAGKVYSIEKETFIDVLFAEEPFGTSFSYQYKNNQVHYQIEFETLDYPGVYFN